MTLRRYYRVFIGTQLVIILLLAAALISTTTILRELNQLHVRSLKSILAVLNLEVSLYEYNRIGNLFVESRDPAVLLERAGLRKRIHDGVVDAEAFTSSPAERRSVERLKAALADYLHTRDKVEGDPEHYPDAQALARPPFEHVLGQLGALVAVNTAQSEKASADAKRWDGTANVLGIILLAVAALAGMLAAFHVKRGAFTPLLELERRVRDFAANPAARLQPSGFGELRSVAGAFNAMADELAYNRRRQFQFLAGVAHDLRNPLTAIKSRVELLQLRPPEPQELPRFLAVLSRQVERLNEMLQDLLDANRIEAGQLDLRPAWNDLATLAKEALALVHASAEKHTFRLDAPPQPVMAYCDPLRVVQILNNLVANAIKFSPAGGEISVAIDETAAHATVTVCDRGVGIHPEEADLIFQPFRRTSDPVKAAIPGVGLGLSISRKLAEAHGGTLTARSAPGEGSCFKLELRKQAAGQM